jgi:hypothetical protein
MTEITGSDNDPNAAAYRLGVPACALLRRCGIA